MFSFLLKICIYPQYLLSLFFFMVRNSDTTDLNVSKANGILFKKYLFFFRSKSSESLSMQEMRESNIQTSILYDGVLLQYLHNGFYGLWFDKYGDRV